MLGTSACNSNESEVLNEGADTKNSSLGRSYIEDIPSDSILVFDVDNGVDSMSFLVKNPGLTIKQVTTESDYVKFVTTSTCEWSGTEELVDWLHISYSDQEIKLKVDWVDNLAKENNFTITMDNAGTSLIIRGRWAGSLLGHAWTDPIELTPSEYAFSPDGETTLITATHLMGLCGLYIDNGDGKGWESINLLSESGIHEGYLDDFLIKREWITIKREDNNLRVTLDPNNTQLERKFIIHVNSGDYFSWGSYSQKSI